MTDPGTNDTLHVHVAPDGAIVASGDIDVAGGPILDAVIMEQEQSLDGSAAIVIDLTDVTFIDSSGLRTIVEAHQARAAAGTRLVLRSPSAAVQRLLEISGLAGHLDVAS